MAVDTGTGTTITFATSAFAPNIVDVDMSGATREAIDQTHMGSTGWKTFLAGALIDGGEANITIQFDAALTAPIDQAAETVTIDWAGNGNNWVFTAFMTNYAPGAQIEELMQADVTLKVSGAITGI